MSIFAGSDGGVVGASRLFLGWGLWLMFMPGGSANGVLWLVSSFTRTRGELIFGALGGSGGISCGVEGALVYLYLASILSSCSFNMERAPLLRLCLFQNAIESLLVL